MLSLRVDLLWIVCHVFAQGRGATGRPVRAHWFDRCPRAIVGQHGIVAGQQLDRVIWFNPAPCVSPRAALQKETEK
jgi:hypothetical protein